MNAPVTATEDLIYSVENGIARIVFNRPQSRNAMTFAMYEQMASICESINKDRSIKALIIAKCVQRGLPVITSGSAGGRRDATAVKLTDLGFAGADMLLKGTRQSLRRDFGFAKSMEGRPMAFGVPCVFSTERAIYPQADGTCKLEPQEGTEAGLRLDCAAGFGAATFVTGTFGFVLAGEVVRHLSGV